MYNIAMLGHYTNKDDVIRISIALAIQIVIWYYRS